MTDILKKFLSIWNKVSDELDQPDLDQSIKKWLEKLGYNSNEQKKILDSINSFSQENKVFEVFFELYKNLLVKTHKKIPISKLDLLDMGEKTFNSIEPEKFKEVAKELSDIDMNKDQLLLIAFILASVGCTIYLLNEKKPKKSGNQKKEDHFGSVQKQEVIVFLAINADCAEEAQILDDLKRGIISPRFVKFIQRTSDIKTLWQGYLNEYTQKKINNCFDDCEKIAVKESNDIYLIEIKLDSSRTEFKDGSLSARWYKGFKAIADEKVKLEIKVSERMHKEAVNNPYLKIPK